MKIEADKQLDGMQWRCKLVMKREVWTGFLHALLFLTLHTTAYPPPPYPIYPWIIGILTRLSFSLSGSVPGHIPYKWRRLSQQKFIHHHYYSLNPDSFVIKYKNKIKITINNTVQYCSYTGYVTFRKTGIFMKS